MTMRHYINTCEMKALLVVGYCLYAVFAFSSTLGRKD